jgi:hypothetical protein
MMLFYLRKHVKENEIREHHYNKCCFVNTCGFLAASFIFAAMIVAHQLWPHLILVPPGHQPIGAGLLAFALFTDVLWARLFGTTKEGGCLNAADTERNYLQREAEGIKTYSLLG